MYKLNKAFLLIFLIKLINTTPIDDDSKVIVPTKVIDYQEYKVVKRAPQTYSYCAGGFLERTCERYLAYCKADSFNISRPAHESDCVFPFFYNDTWYDSCTKNGKGFFWCSIDRIYNKKWAPCREACPMLAKKMMAGQSEPHISCLNYNKTNLIPHFPNSTEIDLILQYHNKIRADVAVPTVNLTFPPASNMNPLTYDFQLAKLAQTWVEYLASTNQFKHDCDTCRNLINPNNRSVQIGQNLFLIARPDYTYSTNLQKFWTIPIVNAWGGEKKNFLYGASMPSTTGDVGHIGHYSQIVNSETYRVGCGSVEFVSKSNWLTYITGCNYANPVFDKSRPYKNGTACSKCSGQCINNMCQCNKICQNYGVLDTETCTCKCRVWATGAECEHRLCDKPDSGYNCMYPNRPDLCIYGNVKYDCPHMCGFCTSTFE